MAENTLEMELIRNELRRIDNDLKARIQSVQIQLENKVEKSPKVDIKNLVGSFKVQATAPTLADVTEGGFVFYDDGGSNQDIYCVLNGVLYKVSLTAV